MLHYKITFLFLFYKNMIKFFFKVNPKFVQNFRLMFVWKFSCKKKRIYSRFWHFRLFGIDCFIYDVDGLTWFYFSCVDWSLSNIHCFRWNSIDSLWFPGFVTLGLDSILSLDSWPHTTGQPVQGNPASRSLKKKKHFIRWLELQRTLTWSGGLAHISLILHTRL